MAYYSEKYAKKQKHDREIMAARAKDLIAHPKKYDKVTAVTSELNMSDSEIRDIYRGLARIEETFKISKSEFESRPVFVWTNAHIEGHFATCFTALVLIRLLQIKLGRNYPIGKTIESLRKYNCTQIDNTLFQFVYYDEILEECGKVFQLELNNKYRTREQVRRILKY